MRFTTLMYLLGMFLVLLGERMIGGEDTWRWGLDALGVLCLLGVLLRLGQQVKIGVSENNTGRAQSHKLALLFALIGTSSLGVYALSTGWGMDLMGHDLLSGNQEEADAAERYWVVTTCLWLILWLVGTLPFVAADWVLNRNPMAVDASATRKVVLSTLAMSLLLSALFPINYWASQQDPSDWVADHSYFKAPVPGEQTRLLVANLDEPITAYAFFPEADVVRDQVERYLGALEGEGGLFAVEFVDQALEPTLAEDLQIRDNGWIAFVRGEGAERQVERLRLGQAKRRRDLDTSTRNKIKDLDQEVLQQLRKIASSRRTIYVTNGHGELHWGSQSQFLDGISTLKSMVMGYNYRVESLGMTNGLTDEVPDDAAMVLVLGPTQPFLPSEIEALNEYRRSGGSLLIGLRPAFEATVDLSGLLEPLGLEFDGSQVLAHANYFGQLTGGPQDQFLIYTQSYSSHDSVQLLQRQKEVSRPLYMPISGVLSEVAGGEATPTVAIRSMPETWGETSRRARFDEGVETQEIFNLAYAISGPIEEEVQEAEEGEDGETESADDPTEPEEWRVFVTASANWMSDPLITGARSAADPRLGNAQLVADLLGWLGHDATVQGSVNSEEDRKVEHTSGAAGWIFYGTTFVVPFVFLFLGLVRLSVRRQGGES